MRRPFRFLNPVRLVKSVANRYRTPVRSKTRFRAVRQQYVEQCLAYRGIELQPAQAMLAARRSEEQSRRLDLFRTVRCEKLRSYSEGNIEQLRRSLKAQWEQINKIEHVAGVCMSSNTLLVRTDNLTGQSLRTKLKYELGHFLIFFNLDGSDEPVRWFNQTRRIDGAQPRMNAPTVYEDGSCAACELKETLVELIAQLELVPAVELAIQYLQCPDNQLLESFASRWPKVS